MQRIDRLRGFVKIFFVVVALVLLMLVIYKGGRWLETRNEQEQVRGSIDRQFADKEVVGPDGSVWKQKKNITSILLMGIDRESDEVVSGFRNGGQADFLQLIVVDKEEKTITQLQIDRDTMTPITVLGILGDRSGVRTAQVCLSHGFGDGKEQSCELTKQAVENLLFGSEIDFYAAVNMDGISALNDWAGGVTVTLEDDFTAVDPEMSAGKTLTLTGDQAETYVRSRKEIGEGTNAARMQRQAVYIDALTEMVRGRITQSESELNSFYEAISPYLITDMARGRIINEIWNAKDYRLETARIEGEHVVGSDGFMQFLADSDALQTTVLELFCDRPE